MRRFLKIVPPYVGAIVGAVSVTMDGALDARGGSASAVQIAR
jgi:hypothetical protein